jgi:hypothetical protein
VRLDLPRQAEAHQGHAGQLGAVVGHAHRWSTAPGDDDIEQAGPAARYRQRASGIRG